MKTFKEYLTEGVTLTGTMVHSGMMEGYVNLFYKTLSASTKSYKKYTKENFLINGCGEVYDVNTTTKIVDKRPFYKLTSQIITNYGRVFYTLDMDIDSSNVVTMYREYGDRSKVDKYHAVMLAKKNILNALKEAGFTVRSDRASIYASLTNYVKNPSDENGLVLMNFYQKSLLKTVKKLFSYDGISPAYNMYALTLLQAKLLVDLEDENQLNVIPAGNSYSKVVVSTNGKINLYRYENDDTPEKTLTGCFEPIQKDFELED